MHWPRFKRHQSQGSTPVHTSVHQSTTQPSAQSQSMHQSAAWPQSRKTAPTEQDRQSAEALKKEGNAYFGKAKYGAAIEKYTEAITLCPDWSVLLVNRAMCQRKKEVWDLVKQDAEAALMLDSHLMKAHYLLGMALRHTKHLRPSIEHLQQALDAARQQNDNIKDEIWHELAQVQYLCWKQESAEALDKQQLLQGRLQHLLQEQHVQELRMQGGSASVQQAQAQESAALDQVFVAAKRGLIEGEPAAAFTCPLTMEVFRDPVMTPSGLSYERSALMDHLRKVGEFDPITRKAMKANQITPNVALRNATLQYLQEHPWAWAECC